MTTIAVSKELVRLCRAADISLFLWGAHGIGKSSLVKESAAALEIGFVDLRCAQLDAVDLRGFPEKGNDGRTHFLPPADLPGEGEGILFLDELNRAGPDVLAALFQLVLDRRIGEYQLPAGWSIVAAGNFDSGDYMVNELDPAFRDRFCHSVVSAGQSTLREWTDWMFAEHGEKAYEAVNFCSMNPAHLEAESSDQLTFKVEPTRRSWDAVVRGLAVMHEGDYSKEAKKQFLAGLVGMDLAISFMHHQPTLRPSDVLRLGVRRVRPRLKRCDRAELSVIMSGLLATLDESHANTSHYATVLDFAEFLAVEHPDLSIAFMTGALAKEPAYKDLAVMTPMISNTRLARRVAEMQGNQGFLAELVKRDRLASRLGELLAPTA